MSVILSIEGLVKTFGGLIATDHVSLDVREGEIHRVRIVLGVVGGASDGKISIFDPDTQDGIRQFMLSRVKTLPWLDSAPQLRREHA